jgi:hypothetical protein
MTKNEDVDNSTFQLYYIQTVLSSPRRLGASLSPLFGSGEGKLFYGKGLAALRL